MLTSKKTSGGAKTVNIVSWNTNGFEDKQGKALKHLRELKADVVLLQETHIGPKAGEPPGSTKIKDLGQGYDWAIFTVYRRNSRGVAVLIKRGLACEGLKFVADKKGRYIMLTCSLHGEDYTFVNIYNPSDEKIHFPDIQPVPGTLVIAGDFNTVLNCELDKTSKVANRGHKERLKNLRDFLQSLHLVDTWRCLHPEEKIYTYFDKSKKSKSRLDYFFVSSKTMSRVMSCNIHQRPKYPDKDDFMSDHAPISLQLITGDQLWQFNRNLLQDEVCVSHLKGVIDIFSRKKSSQIWMGLKCRLRCETFSFAHRLQKGPKVGLRHVGEGKTFTSASAINSELEVYLDYLYRSRNKVELQYVMRAVLVEHVSRQEILSTICSLEEDSHTPVPDGFPVAFYKVFSCQVSDHLQACFNEILDLKPLSFPFREVLSLKQEDSCRLFSCFNVDYMIFASILARRLQSILKHIMYLGGSRAQDLSPKDCFHAMCRARDSNSPTLVISLSVQSHGVKWPYLFQRLKVFELPLEFRKLLKNVLTQSDAKDLCSNIPGGLSRGLLLGCPLTPVLLGLCLEPLAQSIHLDVRVVGLALGEEPLKVSIQSDQILVFMSCPTALSSSALLETLAEFSLNSGVQIDVGQSTVFNVGFPKPADGSVLQDFQWSVDGFFFQGCWISLQEKACLKRNLEPLCLQLKSDLEKWTSETSAKKARLIKKHHIPRFQTVFQRLPDIVNKEQCEEIDQFIASFVQPEDLGRVTDWGIPHLYCCALLTQ